MIAEFESHSLLIEKGEEKQVRERHKSLPTADLWARGHNKDIAEVQWRISAAIMTVVLCFFAMRFANTGPRQGRYAGLFPAILLYIVYSNLLGVSRAWVAKGMLSPWLGGLWVHLLMIIVLLVMFNQQKISQVWAEYKLKKGLVS